jgi:uncharacterized protein YaeQ
VELDVGGVSSVWWAKFFMGAKYSFRFESRDRRRELPGGIIIAQNDTETIAHVVLKMLGFVLFYRERLQIEGDVHNDSITYKPDLVWLDYDMRPKLWVECGECSVNKLDKLAVKVHNAEIWVLKKSPAAAEHLLAAMAKEELRRDRYHILSFEEEMFGELCGLVTARNEMVWFGASFETGQMQFEFNQLWFEAAFTVTKF